MINKSRSLNVVCKSAATANSICSLISLDVLSVEVKNFMSHRRSRLKQWSTCLTGV